LLEQCQRAGYSFLGEEADGMVSVQLPANHSGVSYAKNIHCINSSGNSYIITDYNDIFWCVWVGGRVGGRGLQGAGVGRVLSGTYPLDFFLAFDV
jgi:hypothetical protein